MSNNAEIKTTEEKTSDKKADKTLVEKFKQMAAPGVGLGIAGAVAMGIPVPEPVKIAIGAYLTAKFGSTTMWNFLDMGDPEGKSAPARFIQWLIKRGENDIPKEVQTILKGYEGVINLSTKTVGILSGIAAAVPYLAMYFLNTKKAKKESADKKITEELKKILEQTENIENFTNFLEADNKTDALSNSQLDLIDQTLQTNNAELKRLFKTNLYGWLHLDPNKGNNLEEFKKHVERRKKLTSIYDNFVDKFDINPSNPLETKSKLQKLIRYINNPATVPLDEKYKNAIGTVLNGGFSATSPEALALKSDLNMISKRLESGESLSEILDEIKFVTGQAEKIQGLQDILDKYQEAWFAGGAFNTVGFNDTIALSRSLPTDIENRFNELGFTGVSTGYNPLMLLGFTTIPTNTEVEAEEERIDNLKIPDRNTIDESIENVRNVYKGHSDELVTVRNFLSSRTPKEIENLSNLANIINTIEQNQNPPLTIQFNNIEYTINNPEIINSFKKVFERRKDSENEDIYSLIQGILDLQLLIDESTLDTNDKENLIKLLNSLNQIADKYILLDEFVFGKGKLEGERDLSVVSFIKLLNQKDSNITKLLYEGYGGNFSSLINDSGEFLDRGSEVQSKLQSVKNDKLTALKQLKNVLADQAKRQTLRQIHLDHLNSILNGDIVVLKNIVRGRDWLNFLDLLRNYLIEELNKNTPLSEYLKDKDLNLNIPRLYLPEKLDPEKPLTESDFETNAYLKELVAELKKVTFVLLKRYLEINDGSGDLTEDSELQSEFLDITEKLNILPAIGFKFDGRDEKNNPIVKEDLKKFKMYLNGTNVAFGPLFQESINNSLSENARDIGLRVGKFDVDTYMQNELAKRAQTQQNTNQQGQNNTTNQNQGNQNATPNQPTAPNQP